MKIGIDLRLGRVLTGDTGSLQTRFALACGAAVVDFVAVAAVSLVASVLYHLGVYGHPGSIELTIEMTVLLGGVFVFVNMLQRRYRLQRHLTTKGQMVEAFNAWNVTLVAVLAIAFLAKRIDDYSRAVVILTYLLGIPAITLARWHMVKLTLSLTRSGLLAAQRVLLVGREREIIAFVSRHIPWNMGLVIQDAITLRPEEDGASPEEAARQLGRDLALAVARARQIRPDAVFIALPWSDRATIERCVEAFLTVPAAINLAPEYILESFENPRIVRTGAIPSLELTPPPLTTPAIVLKRLFDIVASAALLLALSPLLGLIALLIKLDSKGPVFFLQRRYGFNQEPFRIIKFRTMRTLEDGDQIRQATVNDPRVTRAGAWLRRWNLDELPQLANVLMGQMSLVGPRPHALAHDREFETKIARYARRHNVRPGITGWAQVNGFRGETDTDEKMVQRVAHDLWYIDNWNFWLDLVIMVRTVASPKAFRNAR